MSYNTEGSIFIYKNAVEVIQKIKPDLIFDSEFPTLIDLSFLAASRNNSLYVRKFSSHKMFKVPLKLHSTLSRLNTNIPIDDKKKKSGRPKKTTLDEEFCFHAIEFARLHGLKATRNDESTSFSACDAVSDAATALSQSRVPGFNQGFGFEVLKKIWAKHSK